MSHIMLRPVIVKLSVSGVHFHLGDYHCGYRFLDNLIRPLISKPLRDIIITS